jgi:hypothetical protein
MWLELTVSSSIAAAIAAVASDWRTAASATWLETRLMWSALPTSWLAPSLISPTIRAGRASCRQGLEHAALAGVADLGGEVAVGRLLHHRGGLLGSPPSWPVTLTLMRQPNRPSTASRRRDAAQESGDRAELPVHVVHVDAGADDPAPGQSPGVGQLGLRLGPPGLGTSNR